LSSRYSQVPASTIGWKRFGIPASMGKFLEVFMEAGHRRGIFLFSRCLSMLFWYKVGAVYLAKRIFGFESSVKQAVFVDGRVLFLLGCCAFQGALISFWLV
jgi:hypothetical protein